jgi:hypothetical protein
MEADATVTSAPEASSLTSFTDVLPRPLTCRHGADETLRHGSTRSQTASHSYRAEPCTVQHVRVRAAPLQHGPPTSAKPPSAVRLRSPPPTTSLHLAISGRVRSRTGLLIRQDCRHLADETRRDSAVPGDTGAQASRRRWSSPRFVVPCGNVEPVCAALADCWTQPRVAVGRQA